MIFLRVFILCLVRRVLEVSCARSCFLCTMAPTKEDLGKLKTSELQRELEVLNLDTGGKKAELVERLWAAMQRQAAVMTERLGMLWIV